MNDYKGLIARLRAIGEHLKFDKTSCVYLAADAIEQLVVECKTLKHNLATVVKDCDKLVKERDAAVNCIPKACAYCKHFEVTHNGETFDYNCSNNNCTNISGVNSEWEWRGVGG